MSANRYRDLSTTFLQDVCKSFQADFRLTLRTDLLLPSEEVCKRFLKSQETKRWVFSSISKRPENGHGLRRHEAYLVLNRPTKAALSRMMLIVESSGITV
jgi:hypothetical protein